MEVWIGGATWSLPALSSLCLLLSKRHSLDRHIPRPRALLSSRSGVTTRPLTPTSFPSGGLESARAAPLRADEADARLRERLSQAEAVGGARVFHGESGRPETGLSAGEETEAMTIGADTVT